MHGSVSAKMQQLEMSHTHCAEAQQVDSPESFLSSLQEALGESISQEFHLLVILEQHSPAPRQSLEEMCNPDCLGPTAQHGAAVQG